MREERKEVLVTGAGPVGLWTALLLAEGGVDVGLIDRESRTTTRSYACALQPAALQSLARLGLAEPLIAQGRRVEKMVFYDGQTPRAELKFSHVSADYPFLLILPQSALEGALEERLKRAGVPVNWNYRFDTFQAEEEELAVMIEELEGTSTGYIVPHWETVVKRRRPLRVQFLVGTDGHNSLVRERLGTEYTRLEGPQFFVAYEFEAEQPVAGEVRVVIDDTTTNVLWPLSGNRARWTFQVLKEEIAFEFPEKERRAVRIERKKVDERLRDYVQRVAVRRAPWFKERITGVEWCTEVVFEQRLVKQFGRGRCWLAGDAAHQTGPVGVQSMNAGFLEGEALARGIKDILRGEGTLEALKEYDREFQKVWSRILGMERGLVSGTVTDPWVAGRRSRILPCLPGVRGDIDLLAKQLELELK